MDDVLGLLTFEWLFYKILIGILIGYFFRISEHLIWAQKAPAEQNPNGNLGFALLMLPQSIVFGASLGFLLVALVGIYTKSAQILLWSAYAFPALAAFVAGDLRELLRRVSRI